MARLLALGALLFVAGTGVANAAVSISAPASANLGSAPTGSSTLSAQLGTVTATASGVVGASFTATVTCTDFTTGAGTAGEKILKASISYWSGPATASSGLGSGIPGQATALQAQNLSVARTAFQGSAVLLSVSVSWNPTIVVSIPSAAVAGTYTGTITHSVA